MKTSRFLTIALTVLALVGGAGVTQVVTASSVYAATKTEVSIPEPANPGCEYGWLKTSIDCKLADTFSLLKLMTDRYLPAGVTSEQRRAPLHAIVWSTLGGAAVSSKNGNRIKTKKVNVQYIQAAIDEIEGSNGISSDELLCTRNALMTYLIDSKKNKRAVDNTYNFIEYWTTRDELDTYMGSVGVAPYLTILKESKATVLYIGRTEQVRNASRNIIVCAAAG